MTNVVELKNRLTKAYNSGYVSDLSVASQVHYFNHLKKQREKALEELYSVYMEETEQESETWKYASLE